MEKPKTQDRQQRRQLGLLDRTPCSPAWETLPLEVRKETVRLMRDLLRASGLSLPDRNALPESEVDDE